MNSTYCSLVQVFGRLGVARKSAREQLLSELGLILNN